MLLELSELQTRREGWAGSGRAGLWELRIRDFIPGTVGFAIVDGVLRQVTWFAFSSSGLSVLPCVLLWDGPESGLDLSIPMEHMTAQ